MTEQPRNQVFEDTARGVMRALGMEPDPWQMDVLMSTDKRLLLNCCRQSGKSTVAALLSVLETVAIARTKVLIMGPSLRQSQLVFQTAANFLQGAGQQFVKTHTIHEIKLFNKSEIICLPCSEDTIRGYAKVNLLIIDEAARVPDDLFRALTPMLAVSDGRMICMSTPYGRRGYFYNAWAKGGDDWKRIEVPVTMVPRVTEEYRLRANREMGETWFRQEFFCSFEAMEGLVYPNFARCVVKVDQVPPGRWYGGVDFGLRNPFAAIWGVLDRDNVLWLVGEHYEREKSLDYHAKKMPRGITWFADPSGAREIKELICANLTVRKADNDRQSGITAVRSRIECGTLKIVEGACPQLLAESQLYRYDSESDSEDPVKEHDHALDALRYLIAMLDRNKMARIRKGEPAELPPPALPAGVSGVPPKVSTPLSQSPCTYERPYTPVLTWVFRPQ